MAATELKQLIGRLGDLKTSLYQKDFLLTWRQSADDLKAVLLAAEALEDMYRANISTRMFQGGLAVSNFRDKSTRTRFSFASASSLLGLTPHDFDESKIQVSHGETVRETANMISFLTEVIGIRDDMYIGEGHELHAGSLRLGGAGLQARRPAAAAMRRQPAVRHRPSHPVPGGPLAPAEALRQPGQRCAARRSP